MLQPVGSPLAAGQQRRAFVYAEADLGLDSFPLPPAHHGADLNPGICCGADFERLDMVLQLYQRFVQPAFRHEEVVVQTL